MNNILTKRLAAFLMLSLLAFGQAPIVPPVPVKATLIYNITSTTIIDCSATVFACIDNRSAVNRQNDYHSYRASGSGTWSIDMQFADGTPTGWVSYGSTAQISNTSPPSAIGFGLDPNPISGKRYHDFIRFVITGNASIANYTGLKDIWSLPSAGAISYPLLVNQGGTGLTVPTTTVDLLYTTYALACAAAVFAGNTLTVFNHWINVPSQACSAQSQYLGGSIQPASAATVTVRCPVSGSVKSHIWDTSLGNIALSETCTTPGEFWGGVGDGSTDNALPFNTGFTALSVHGGTISLSGAVYDYASHLAMQSNTHLVCESRATTLTPTSPMGADPAIQAISISNFSIENCTISVTTSARLGPFTTADIYTSGSSNFQLKNLHLIGSWNAGMVIDDLSTVFEVRDNLIEQTRADCVHTISGSSDGKVINNIGVSCGDDNFSVVGYTATTSVTPKRVIVGFNQSINSLANGWRCEGCQHTSIIGNITYNPAAHGGTIEYDPGFGLASDVLVADNQVIGANQPGFQCIVVAGSSGHVISNLLISNLKCYNSNPVAIQYASNVTLSGVRYDSGTDTSSSGSAAVFISQVSDFSVSGLDVSGYINPGLELTFASYGNINGVHCHNVASANTANGCINSNNSSYIFAGPTNTSDSSGSNVPLFSYSECSTCWLWNFDPVNNIVTPPGKVNVGGYTPGGSNWGVQNSLGHWADHGPVVTVTTTGGSGCVKGNTNDNGGVVAVTSATTQCTITVNNPYQQPIPWLTPSTGVAVAIDSLSPTVMVVKVVSSGNGFFWFGLKDLN